MAYFDFHIIIPVYYNADSLAYVEEELRNKVLTRNDGLKGEIIFIDDGSGDDSFSKLTELKNAHRDDIRVYRLSRNFGQVAATYCGFCNVDSGATIWMAADGQEPVEVINEMLDAHFYNHKEIVIACRKSRDESWWRKFSSYLTYWLMQKMVNKEMPVGGFDFCLLGNSARSKLCSIWQPNTFIQARILSLGFSRKWISYDRKSRIAGFSRWTFSKKVTYLLDGILGHSYLPIRLMSLSGFLFSMSAFILLCYFLISYFVYGAQVRGLTPIMLLILFIGGVQMVMIGIIGEYLWRTLAQVRQDPPYIIEQSLE